MGKNNNMRKKRKPCNAWKQTFSTAIILTLVVASLYFPGSGIFTKNTAYAAEQEQVTLGMSIETLDDRTTDKIMLTVSIAENAECGLSSVSMNVKYPAEFDLLEAKDLDFFENGGSFFGETGSNPMYCAFYSHGTASDPKEFTTKANGNVVSLIFEANTQLEKGKSYKFEVLEDENLTASLLKSESSPEPEETLLKLVTASPCTYVPRNGAEAISTDGNTAVIKLTPDEYGQAAVKQQTISKALESGKDLAVDMRTVQSSGNNSAALELSGLSAEAIKAANKSLSIYTDVGTVSIDAEAMNEIANTVTNKTLVISVTTRDTITLKSGVKNAVDFNVSAKWVDSEGNETAISKLKSGKVGLGFELPNALLGKAVKCWRYTDTNYALTEGTITYNEFKFQTSYFSNYLLGEEETLEAFASEKNLSKGVTVSGTAISRNDTDDAVYLLYAGTTEDSVIRTEWKDNSYEESKNVIYSDCTKGTVSANADTKRWNQSFSFSGVSEGTYKLAILKPGHGIWIETISVESSDIIGKNIELYKIGDVNCDGAINVIDVQMCLQLCFGTPSGEDIDKADMDENGSINIVDVQEILEMCF